MKCEEMQNEKKAHSHMGWRTHGRTTIDRCVPEFNEFLLIAAVNGEFGYFVHFLRTDLLEAIQKSEREIVGISKEVVIKIYLERKLLKVNSFTTCDTFLHNNHRLSVERRHRINWFIYVTGVLDKNKYVTTNMFGRIWLRAGVITIANLCQLEEMWGNRCVTLN